ncbi:MAG: T9SS type A sorting domain-containing protein [Bacteroidota bacterium]
MKFLTLLILIAFPFFSIAQSLSPTVIASYGKWSDNGGFTLSATSGEMMVQTFTSAANFLTQGFQQPEKLVDGIQQLNEDGLNISIFPNPTADLLTVNLEAENAEGYAAVMYDVLGRMLALPGTLDRNRTQLQQTFNLSQLPSATYFVCILNAQGEINHSFKIQKISF